MIHRFPLACLLFTVALHVEGASLLNHWPLDDEGGATVADLAGSADLSIIGSTAGWTTGRVGGAFEFNGSNYAVSAEDAVGIPSSGGVALAFWFRTGLGFDTRDVVLDIEDLYTVRINGDQAQVTFTDSIGSSPRFGAELDEGLWHHLVAQNDGSTTSVYIDGELAGSFNETAAVLTTKSRSSGIAARRNGNNRFDGAIDDVRFYDGTLTLAEIRTLAQITNQPPVARDDAYTVAIGTQLTVVAPGVLGNDSETDGDSITAQLVAGVAEGTLKLNADGSFTYDPPAGFSGVLEFSYEALDKDGTSAVAVVQLTILDPASSLTPEEVDQIETELGITLTAQEILDLSAIVKPQALPGWRSDAYLRIENHRKADLTVQVVDSQGVPVPSADVRLKLLKHDFKFSGVVTVQDLTDANSDLSNAGSDVEDWKRITKAFFNSLGLNNGFKPKIVSQHQYIPGFMSWAAANDLDVRGHLLIWPGGGDLETLDTVGAVSGVDYGNHLSNSSTSNFASYNVLGAVDAYKASGRTQADRDALEAVVDAEIQEWVSQWDVYEWDVINETISNQLLMELLGFDQMAEWFKIAENNRVNPNTKLFINDFQIISARFTGTSYITRRDTYFNHIDQILAGGAQLDGIGFQSRFKFLEDYDPAVIYGRLEEFSTRYPGLNFSGTEFEVKDNYNFVTGELEEAYDEITRARVTEEVMTTYFSHQGVTGLSAWDFINPLPDGTDSAYSRALAYYGDGAGGVDGPLIKLNGLVWYYLHRIRYNNDLTGSTAANGEVTLRGFKGEQLVTVKFQSKNYSVPVTLLADGSQQVQLPDVTLESIPTEKVIERWDFDEPADTGLLNLSNSAGTAAFTETHGSIATNGAGKLLIGQSAFVTAQFNGDFVVAEPLTHGPRTSGKYELEFVVAALDFTSGDPNGASVGFGLKDSIADEELFVVRLNKTVGGLVVSSFIDSSYTQIQSFPGQLALTEPLRIRSVIDLDSGFVDVYTQAGSAAEAFQARLDVSAVATNWDQILLALQNNKTDWGVDDFAAIDYVQIRKLEMDNFVLWLGRTNWAGETAQDRLDDPDGDGLTNLLEYALGGDPLVGDALSRLPFLSDEGNTPYFTLTLGADSIDLIYELEQSLDLLDWTTLPAVQINGEPGELVRVPLLAPGEEKRFVRLSVREN